MIVRCAYCGSVMPEKASKCYECGNENILLNPPEIPKELLAELEIEKKRVKKTELIVTTLMTIAIVVCFLLAMFGFGNAFQDDAANFVSEFLGSIGMIISAIIWKILHDVNGKDLKKLEKAIDELRCTPKATPSEYYQMLLEFIGRG